MNGMESAALYDEWKDELFSSFDDNYSHGIALLNEHGNVLFANNALRQLCPGFSMISFINPTFEKLIFQATPANPVFDCLLTIGEINAINTTIEAKVYRKNDKILITGGINSIHLVEQNKTMHLLTQRVTNLQRQLVREKSELKASEEKFRDLSANLERKVNERTNELNIINEKLLNEIGEHKKTLSSLKIAQVEAEKANQAKSEFLLNISHEFRTPLNAVIGYAELIESAEGKIKKDHAGSIKSSGRRLLAMVDDILDLIRTEKSDIELEYSYVDSVEYFRMFGRSFSTNISEKGLKFITNIPEDLPGSLFVDSKRLQQITGNLISNAIKYTDKGTVTLTISCQKPELPYDERKTDLVIEVSDTGRGMSAEFQKNLFEAFAIEGKKTVLSGVGVGLALTHRLASLMNGKISVISEPDRGSTFRVTIPGIAYREGFTGKDPNVTVPESDAETKVRKEEIKNLTELISALEGALLDTCKSFENRQPMDKVKKFGQALMDLGQTHTCTLISEYGRDLFEAAGSFNIDMMIKLIKEYQNNIDILKNLDA